MINRLLLLGNNDAEFIAHSKNDDLDEGETARLGGDENDLV